MSNYNNRKGEELRLGYKIAQEDILFTKNQQWRITNYCLLIIVALIGFYKYQSVHIDSCGKKVLGVLSCITAAYGTILLIIFQHKLANYRKRLTDITENFTSKFKQYYKESKSYEKFRYNLMSFVLPLIVSLWVGAFFVIWVLYL